MLIAMNHVCGLTARYLDGSIPDFFIFIREISVVRFMVSGARHIVSAEAIRARRFNRIVTTVLPPQPVERNRNAKSQESVLDSKPLNLDEACSRTLRNSMSAKCPLARGFEDSVWLLSSQTIERNFWTSHREVRRGS